MATKRTLLYLLTTIWLSACQDSPVASFEVSTDTAQPGETITFQNTSQNAETYKWDFKDGESSTEENPSHSFSNMGNYEVQLTATNRAGDDVSAVMIHILPSYDCWTQLSNLITPRQTHITALVNNTIYVGGGVWSYHTFEAYDINTDKWTSKADLLFAAEYPGGCALDGKVYFVGGWWENPAYDHLQVYDPATNKWELKAPMPTKRWGHKVLPVNGKIYVVGGFQEWPISTSYKSIEVYDPAEDSWSTINPGGTEFTSRWGIGASVVNNKIYVIGGMNATDYPSQGQFVPALDIVEEFDPESETWNRKTSMPTARWGLATVTVNNKIYAIGGTNEFRVTEFRNIVEVYDPATDTWESFGAMPKGLNAISAVEHNSIIYIPGGGGYDADSEYDCFYAFDPACQAAIK